MIDMTRRQTLALSVAALSSCFAMPRIGRAAAPRRLRLAHNNTIASNVHATAVSFQTKLAELTGGAMTVEIIPSSQLGNDVEIVKSVSEGTLDMTVTGVSVMGVLLPDVFLAEIPYLFNDTGAARRAFDGAYGTFLADGLRGKGVEVVAFAESGLRHVTANRPIRRPDDLAGLKIRVQPSKLQTEAFSALGAAPQAISFSDLAGAMQTGRVEAQENPVGLIVGNEFIAKLQSHLSLTGHIYSATPLALSADVMQELSADQREAVLRAGKAALQASRERSDTSGTANLEKLKSMGMTIVTDVDHAAFRKSADRIDERLAAIYGKEPLGRVRSLIVA